METVEEKSLLAALLHQARSDGADQAACDPEQNAGGNAGGCVLGEGEEQRQSKSRSHCAERHQEVIACLVAGEHGEKHARSGNGSAENKCADHKPGLRQLSFLNRREVETDQDQSDGKSGGEKTGKIDFPGIHMSDLVIGDGMVVETLDFLAYLLKHLLSRKRHIDCKAECVIFKH